MRLDGFTLTRELGSGAMGSVWLGTTADGRRVAVKVASAEVAARPRLRRLVEAEIRAMARLEHPAVLELLDHGVVPPNAELPADAPYLVLEVCSGGTLADRPPGDWPGLLEVVRTLLDALGHAHARGVIHRDLKPANVLRATPADGRPGLRLADFGIAHALGTGPSALVAGTPRFMAPEQRSAHAERQGPWTDLYALGATIDLFWRGSPDFPGPPLFPAPPGFAAFVDALRAADPAARPRDVPTAVRLLREVAPEVRPPPAPWTVRSDAMPKPASPRVAAARTPPTVGREEERAELLAVLREAVTTRRPGLVVLRGTEGTGRTHLLDWLVRHCLESGAAAVVRARCGAGGDPGLEVIAGVLDLRDLSPGDLRRAVIRRLTETGAPQGEVAALHAMLEEGSERWGAVPVVRELLRGRARRDGGLILLLDDAERSDGAVALARALLAEPDEAPLAVVVTADAEPGPLDAAGGRTRPLHPLTPGEAELMVGVLGVEDPQHRTRWVSRVGTLPGDLVRAVRGERDVGALQAWLAHASERGVLALERAAVLGAEVDETEWEALDDTAGDSPTEVRARVAALGDAFREGLLVDTPGGFRFARSEVREGLIARAAAAGRLSRHHLAAAAVLEHSPKATQRRAMHLLQAGRHDLAVPILLTLSIENTNRDIRRYLEVVDALEEAVEHLETPTDSLRAAVAIGRATTALQAGRMAEARGHAERGVALARASGDRSRASAAYARRADTVVGAVTDAATQIAALQDFLDHDDGTRPRQSALQRGRLAALLRATEPARAAQLYAEAVESLRGREDLESMAARLELRTRMDPPSPELLLLARQVQQQARTEGASIMQVIAVNKVLEVLRKLGRWEEVHAAAPEARTLARWAGREYSRWVVEAVALEAAMRCGAAEEALTQVEQLLPAAPDPHVMGYLLVCRFQAAYLVGDTARLFDTLDRLRALLQRHKLTVTVDDALPGLDDIWRARLREAVGLAPADGPTGDLRCR